MTPQTLAVARLSATPAPPQHRRSLRETHRCRIVLTGGPGGGKTTAADLFRSRNCEWVADPESPEDFAMSIDGAEMVLDPVLGRAGLDRFGVRRGEHVAPE